MIVMKTNVGEIYIELNKEKAPMSSRNFLKYCQEDFYRGTIFHRVIDNFIVQAGGYDSAMNEKSTHAPIVNEANRGLKNVLGSIAMARTEAPHSATSEFFINLTDNPSLDYTEATNSGWGYAVFGQVVTGMDVVSRIAETKTHTVGEFDDVPVESIVIESTTIVD